MGNGGGGDYGRWRVRGWEVRGVGSRGGGKWSRWKVREAGKRRWGGGSGGGEVVGRCRG